MLQRHESTRTGAAEALDASCESQAVTKETDMQWREAHSEGGLRGLRCERGSEGDGDGGRLSTWADVGQGESERKAWQTPHTKSMRNLPARTTRSSNGRPASDYRDLLGPHNPWIFSFVTVGAFTFRP